MSEKESPNNDMKKNHKNKFKTPEGYFDNFNERLFARMNAEEEEPNVTFLPKSDGFGVPDNYFNSVYPAIKKRLNGDSGKVFALQKYRTFYYAAAAIAALFVLTLAWNLNQDKEIGFEDLASADIETYFENNELGLSSYEIAETVNLENISISDFTEKNIEEESILEYLDENIEDLEDLDLNYEELQ